MFKQTWPWGQSTEDEEAERIANTPASPELAAQQLVAFFERRQKSDNRTRKKARKTPPDPTPN